MIKVEETELFCLQTIHWIEEEEKIEISGKFFDNIHVFKILKGKHRSSLCINNGGVAYVITGELESFTSDAITDSFRVNDFNVNPISETVVLELIKYVKNLDTSISNLFIKNT